MLVMTNYGERLALALATRKKERKDLAAFLNVSVQAVGDVINGKSRQLNASNHSKACEWLGVNATWLSDGVGEMLHDTPVALRGRSVQAIHPEDEPSASSVLIPVSTLEFKGGSGKEFDYTLDESEEPASYRLSFFHKTKTNPSRCKRFKVSGDSMEGTLFDGDSVLVDMGEQAVIDGRVYAIRYGNELRVKRLYKKLDGSLTLKSDNANYGEETIPPDLVAEHITIIGRVIDRSGAGGL